MGNFNSKSTRGRLKYLWLLILIPFMSICAASFAHAQIITNDCETTAIWQPGHGWVAGSEITTCTSTITNITDGSQLIENMNNSCGLGNPCSQAPGDNGIEEGISPEQICLAEQTAESGLDQLAQQVRNDIVGRDPTVEHGTFIVYVNGSLIALEIISSTQQYQLPLNELYAQMTVQGISDTQIRGFIHSHPPSTNNVENLRDGENFMNGFPSPNDYEAYESFASNASAFGANDSQWRAQFGAYIVDPEGTLREFEGFTQPANQDYSEESGRSIPEPGSSEYVALQNTLDQAQNDANNQCGGN